MRYLISLKPIGPYFFGGEKTFGERVGRDNTSEKQNYLVRSEELPQITTLWGAMRYELLRQNNLLNSPAGKEKEITALIGEPFKISFLTTDKPNTGVIERISPLFLEKKGEYYTRIPMDVEVKDGEIVYNESKYALHKLKNSRDGKTYYSGVEKKECVGLPSYNIKEYGYTEKWVSNKNNVLHSPFRKKEQIGIIKSSNEKKEGFFKQELIYLEEDVRFVFVLELKSDDEKQYQFNTQKNIPIYLGGNRSLFMMDIETKDTIKEDVLGVVTNNEKQGNAKRASASKPKKTGKVNHLYGKVSVKKEKEKNVPRTELFEWDTCFSNLKSGDRSVLLSDIYVEQSEADKLDFVWGGVQHFRFMTESNYRGKRPTKSELFNLLKRGAVVYGEMNENLNELLVCQQRFGLGYCLNKNT